jgi:hypothetical protein
MSHIDRLATVSKILLDERVIELRQEVETLKLEIFWRDNSLFRLNEAMKIANGIHVKCRCFYCGLKGRTRLMDEDEMDIRVIGDNTGECKFIPWFDEVLLSRGFVVLETGPDRLYLSHCAPKSSRPLTRNDCMDFDCHLFKLGSFASYAFGMKLWQAKSVNDPELQKLNMLISMLETYDDYE